MRCLAKGCYHFGNSRFFIHVERKRRSTGEFTGNAEGERKSLFPSREVRSVDSFGGLHPGVYTADLSGSLIDCLQSASI